MTDEEHIALKRKAWLLIYAFLIPPWISFLLGAYWYFIDVKSPLTLVYQSPKFSSQKVGTRDEADKYAVSQAVSGITVWLYRETCIAEPQIGEINALWYSKALVLSAPQRSFPPTVGCYSNSQEVRVPTIAIDNDFLYRVTIFYVNNSLVHSKIELPPVPLRIQFKTEHDKIGELYEIQKINKRIDNLSSTVLQLKSKLSQLRTR